MLSFKSGFIRMIATVAIVGLIPLAAPAENKPPVKPFHPNVTPLHAEPRLTNPHLHGAKPAIDETKRIDETKKVEETKRVEHRARYWSHRWDYTAWVSMHRGFGTIAGTVESSGGPAAGAKVWLRTASGRAFGSTAAKHIVFAGPAGEFVMHHVRTGTYRVLANRDKSTSHARVHVTPGLMAMSQLRV
jgi:hypothetical protein